MANVWVLRENVSWLDWCLSRTINLWFLGTKPKRYSHYPISSRCHDFASHFLGKRKLSFALEGRLTLKNKRGVWDKSLTLNIKSEQNKLSDTQNTVLFAFLSNLSILTIYNKEFLKSKSFWPSLLNCLWIVDQDAVVEWPLLR